MFWVGISFMGSPGKLRGRLTGFRPDVSGWGGGGGPFGGDRGGGMLSVGSEARDVLVRVRGVRMEIDTLGSSSA